ncbi:hypothetical protein [Curtobacterium sp. RIT-PI-V]|uniref:hypothetical protein n=1 Tax=Curtobacterium sp. RIT-PI-V TaxID=3035296 RepID=UPI0021D7CC0D|nr:hypothetical protein [Curtobacterium sp. RIT-PI-V]
MTSTSRPASERTAVATTGTIASLSSTVLSVDNLLGFGGSHLFGFGATAFFVALALLGGSACMVFAVRGHDLAPGVAAASVAGFVVTQSPALGTDLWLPLSTALHVLVPLAFAASALVTWSRSPMKVLRVGSSLTAILAVSWAVGGFVPLWLELFLALQAATLLATTALMAGPLLPRVAGFVRNIWDNAAIR